MISTARIFQNWIKSLATFAVVMLLTVCTACSPTAADSISVELEKMKSNGKAFDPTRLHAAGIEGLQRALATVSSQYSRRYSSPKESYAAGFDVYARGINDRERLLLLAQFLRLHLKDGVPSFDETQLNNDKASTIRSCVDAFARNDQDLNAGKYATALAPCLKYANGDVGVWLIDSLDDHGNGIPVVAYGLMIDALDSDYPQLARLAAHSGTEISQTNERDIVHKRLLKLFNGQDEENKFVSSFALMHEFQDRAATDYLLEQTGSADRERALTAIVWIGDTCNWGQAAYPRLLKALDSRLKSQDPDVRRYAVEAMSPYAGPEITQRLLSALADNDPEIVKIARRRLTERAINKSALRDGKLPDILKRYAKEHEDPQVRSECESILKAIDEVKVRDSRSAK
jgi:hypothetical protein